MRHKATPHRPCPCCGARSVVLLQDWKFDEYDVRLLIGKCTECSMIYATNSDEADMSNMKYVQWRPDSDADMVTPKQLIYQRGLLEYLKPHLKPQAWILDYGAGYCGFLRVARDVGFNVEGINPCRYMAGWAGRNLGIPVHPVFGQDFKTNRRYDLVVSQETIEHLVDPLSDLAKIASLLTGGGLAFIAVPNWWTVERLFKGFECLRDPSHYNYFTPKTLGLLYRKVGFNVLAVSPAIGSSPIKTAFKRLINPLGIGNCTAVLQKSA